MLNRYDGSAADVADRIGARLTDHSMAAAKAEVWNAVTQQAARKKKRAKEGRQ
ncbi:MAG: hypothetical protein WBB98_21905 [Xanthobacteraceae bacterium]